MMKFLQYIEECPLQIDIGYSYTSMAFDGCHYYFSLPSHSMIMICDLYFGKIEYMRNPRAYHDICYDFKSDCFWMTSRQYPYKIFKLNRSLQEIDCISINPYQSKDGFITGISCNDSSDNLLLSLTDSILAFNKTTKECTVLKKFYHEWITGILSLDCGFMILSFKEDIQYLCIFDASAQLTKQYCIDDRYLIKNMISNPSNYSCDDIPLSIFATKKGDYSYLLKTVIPFDSSNDVPHQCNDEKSNQHFYNDDFDYDDFYHENPDIVKLIALIKETIINLLEDESDQLKQIITATNDVNQILLVNKEINKTIINSTYLERILYENISILRNNFNSCMDPFEDNCPCCAPCCCPCCCPCCDENHVCVCHIDGGSL